MQTPNLRYLVLTALLLAGAGLYALVGETRPSGGPRWPYADELFTAEGWSVGPLAMEPNDQTDLGTRVFRSSSGTVVSLTIVTSQAPKLYGAGAEVPFVGSGYSVETAPATLVPLLPEGAGTLIARRGAEQWLLVYAYGERRGLLGNGPMAWTLAILDGLAARRNDYYKLYLVSRADQLDEATTRSVAGLAQTLFPRIAAWYAA